MLKVGAYWCRFPKQVLAKGDAVVKIPDDKRVSDGQLSRINQVRSEPREAAEAKRRPAAPRGDEVSLSPTAQDYQTARELLQEVSDVRQEKVRQIKAELKNGERQVEAEKIAERMLAEGLFKDLFSNQ
jgi:negative regulator of flagellin synthesis FlgM